MFPTVSEKSLNYVIINPQADRSKAAKFRMEQQGLTRRDLEAILGTRARVAEVLNGKRDLSIGMIRRLHDQLGFQRKY